MSFDVAWILMIVAKVVGGDLARTLIVAFAFHFQWRTQLHGRCKSSGAGQEITSVHGSSFRLPIADGLKKKSSHGCVKYQLLMQLSILQRASIVCSSSMTGQPSITT